MCSSGCNYVCVLVSQVKLGFKLVSHGIDMKLAWHWSQADSDHSFSSDCCHQVNNDKQTEVTNIASGTELKGVCVCCTLMHQAGQRLSWQVSFSSQQMVNFFDAAVPKITELALLQLAQLPRVRGKTCNKALLVGGFANSKYLETKLRAALQGKVQSVIVPSKPHAAVLSGECRICDLYSRSFSLSAAGYLLWSTNILWK